MMTNDQKNLGVLMKFRISEDVQVIGSCTRATRSATRGAWGRSGASATATARHATDGRDKQHQHRAGAHQRRRRLCHLCRPWRWCDAGLVCVEKRCVPMPDGGLL
jgi:hypothetical protein